MRTTTVDADPCTAARAAMAGVRAGEHRVLVAVAELERDGVAARLGYRSVRRLLEDLWRIDAARARRLTVRAALLAPRVALSGEVLAPVLPTTAVASAEGLLDDGHVRVIAAAMEHLARVPGLDPDRFAAAEHTLAEQACGLSPRGLEKVAHRLVQTLDPDGAAPPENGPPVDELRLVRRRGGSLALAGEVSGRAEAELVVEVFDKLSALAGPDDTRTLAERRAEVLVDLCAHASVPGGIAHEAGLPEADTEPDEQPSGAPPGADATDLFDADDGPDEADLDDTGDDTGDEADRGCPTVLVRGRALLTLTIDQRWLTDQVGHGVLDSGHAVDPEVVRRWACDAGVVPLVLGSRGEPLDVGRLTYTVPAPMRRALHARDRGCSFPGCTRRPSRCHAHHIVHWADGGRTGIGNLALLCRYHHHLVHHDQWEVAMVDGRPSFTPPAAIDPRRRPRPGNGAPLLTGCSVNGAPLISCSGGRAVHRARARPRAAPR